MRTGVIALALCIFGATPALAQIDRRIPVVAFDARAFSSGLNEDAITAEDLGISVEQLPTRALGLVGGAHVYVVRGRKIALGVGGELMLGRGRTQDQDAQGEPVGEPVERRLRSLSPQVSLNFGQRGGWSYLSAGLGPMTYETFHGELPPADEPPATTTLNFGGGARWFFNNHLAVCFDVRFYLTKAVAAAGNVPGRGNARLLILSGGIAFK